MYAIGIDIGTTSICGVVLDVESGMVVKSRTEMSNAFIPTNNLWEKVQDTDKIIALSLEILESFSQYPAVVIGLTGQMHGIVYVNAEGEAVSPLYTWQDGRGKLRYKDTTYADYLGSFSGYGNVTDFYNKVNNLRPENAVSYCTIMDYLGMKICGLNKPIIHTTNAASLGCFDLESNCFTYDVPAEITDKFEIIGRYKGIPVSVAIGDNQASVFSALADEGDVLINVGTGSQVTIVSQEIKKGENIETRPYFEGKYLVAGSSLCGGRAYGILKDFYTLFLQEAGVASADVYSIMNRLIEKRTEDCLKVDTRFAGTRHDPELRGHISDISVDNFTPANLTYGFLCGIVDELHHMYNLMGVDSKELVGSGNGIRKNDSLARICMEKFGKKIKVPLHEEEAAYGAALFGLIACGMYNSASQVQKLVQYEKFDGCNSI